MHSRIGSIQTLRAIAVFAVIAFHYGFHVKNGYLGVDIFFVISGYVIASSLLRQDFSSGAKFLAEFYIRRIKRLFPAFFFVSIVTLVIVIGFYSPNKGSQQNAIKSAIGAILGISNFVLPRISTDYFSSDSAAVPFLHTWSLSIEEQFYLIFPVLLLILLRLKVLTRLKWWFVFAITSVSFLLTIEPIFVKTGLSKISPIFYSPPSRFWEFLVGALIALNGNWKLDSKFLPISQKSTYALLILTLCLPSFNKESLTKNLWVVLISAFSIIIAQSNSNSQMNYSSLLTKTVRHFGDISYSLYLWHWPLLVSLLYIFPKNQWVIRIISLILTFLFAEFSYWAIEQKFSIKRMANQRRILIIFLVGLCIELGVTASAYAGVSTGWNKDWALNSHTLMKSHCDRGILNKTRCNFHARNSMKTLQLVGDSMAWAIGDAVIPSALSHRYSVQTNILNGCSFAIPESNSDNSCSIWRRNLIHELLRIKPNLVVIANSDGYSDTILRSYGEVSALLRKNGSKVMFISPPSGGDEFSERRSILFRPGPPNRYSAIPEYFSLAKHGMNSLLSDAGFRIFEVNRFLCKSNCPIAVDGNDYYTYGGHLSLYADRLLLPAMNKALGSV